MTATSDRSDLRLAELVAALSLGIDLGFGQPMEHVLRQCLIALRIAEQVGLDDDDACRRVLHRPARQCGLSYRRPRAGEVVRRRHRPQVRQVHATSNAACRASWPRCGNSVRGTHRSTAFRTGLEFAMGGFRDLDGMINQHSKLARSLGEQLDLPVATLDGLGGSYERWDGKGWPGELAGAAIPITARIAQLAEFVEVAHRTGGIDAATSLATKGSGTQFDPELCALLRADAEEILSGLDSTNTWDAVIAAEPALAVRHVARSVRRRTARGCDVRRPQVAIHARSRHGGIRPRRRRRSEVWSRGQRADHVATRRRRARSGSSGSIELHLGQAGPARRR